jgi:CHASE3 domain sensor protein
MILPVVACLMLAPVLVWETRESTATVGQIEQSDQRIALARSIETLIVDEETGLRGYQVTSDPRFLQPYHDAEPRMAQAIAQLQSVAGPEETQSLNQFVQEQQTWHQGFAEPLIAVIAAGGRANDDDLNLTGRSRMNTMRSLLAQIVGYSEQRSAERRTEFRRQTRHVLTALVILAGVIGLVIGLFTRDRLQDVSAPAQPRRRALPVRAAPAHHPGRHRRRRRQLRCGR